MIHPFLNLSITGVLWYQGEQNAAMFHNKYSCLTREMVSRWRELFDSDFTYGFVQLAPIYDDFKLITHTPDIRWQQTCEIGTVPNVYLPKSFMASAIDLPDFQSPYGPIHPRDKTDVAERLIDAYSSLLDPSQTFHIGNGPFPSAIQFNKNEIQIDYSNVEDEYRQMKVHLNTTTAVGFEICCSNSLDDCRNSSSSSWISENKIFSWKSTVFIHISDCLMENILGLRYLWRETPCHFKQCPIYSERTDDKFLLPATSFTLLGDKLTFL
ncbi:hypothetical protein SNEBB_007196 [Seison nebaliae]|nr:hypothetical protein SNEBB_007196 [Seison nebaliae]